MKSIINDVQTEVKINPYPKLMLSPITGHVYFMNAETVGMIVYMGDSGKDVFGLGQCRVDWILPHLVDFTGSICLSND